MRENEGIFLPLFVGLLCPLFFVAIVARLFIQPACCPLFAPQVALPCPFEAGLNHQER